MEIKELLGCNKALTPPQQAAGIVDSLEFESQQQNVDEFNQGPLAYDQRPGTSNRDELEQTPAPGVVEGDQPQFGTDQVAAAHQPVDEETGPTNNLNQESNLPQEEMHDHELQESQFGADEETPGQTRAPSEQEREHAKLDHALIGTAAAAASRMDKTTTQQQPQFDTESAAEEYVGDATAAVQPPVEDRLDDLESVPFGELGDLVEQQTQLGTTDGVPGSIGSELDQIPPSDPVEDQTQLGTDDQLLVEDTPALKGEQETTGSAAEVGVVKTNLVEEKLDEPTQQQTQFGTGGVAYEESLEQSLEDSGHQQQQPGEGSWDSELHDPALQQTQLGTESGFQEAPTIESDELEQDQPNR